MGNVDLVLPVICMPPSSHAWAQRQVQQLANTIVEFQADPPRHATAKASAAPDCPASRLLRQHHVTIQQRPTEFAPHRPARCRDLAPVLPAPLLLGKVASSRSPVEVDGFRAALVLSTWRGPSRSSPTKRESGPNFRPSPHSGQPQPRRLRGCPCPRWLFAGHHHPLPPGGTVARLRLALSVVAERHIRQRRFHVTVSPAVDHRRNRSTARWPSPRRAAGAHDATRPWE